MTDRQSSKLPPYSPLAEPILKFASTQTEAIDTHPLRGLAKFGPYSSSAFSHYTPVVRVATVGPAQGQSSVQDLLASLLSKHRPQDRSEYVPEFPGFQQLMKSGLQLASDPAVHILWPDQLTAFAGTGSPQEVLSAAIEAAIQAVCAKRSEFDVLVVHLPDAWMEALRTPDFDAHDFLKVRAALAGVPTQVLNDRAFSFAYRTSLAWRLTIALFVKAGGIPWKLAPVSGVPDNTAYIGLAYAFRGDPTEARFVTCCSQVFDEDGGGMQFVAYEAEDPIEHAAEARRNPYLSRRDMRSVITRSLLLYQSRNSGSRPRRLVIHKQTPFRDEELAGVEDATTGIPEFECVEITSDVAWRGVWLTPPRRGSDEPSQPDAFPVHRGVMVPMSESSALLWAAGNVPDVSTRGSYYQGGKSIPRPLHLTRHAGAGPLEVISSEALALTKMDWNNDALYDPVPVTILYAQRLSRIIANVGTIPPHEYPYRLFM